MHVQFLAFIVWSIFRSRWHWSGDFSNCWDIYIYQTLRLCFGLLDEQLAVSYFLTSFLTIFTQYLLSIYHTLSTVLGVREIVMSKMEISIAHRLVGELKIESGNCGEPGPFGITTPAWKISAGFQVDWHVSWDLKDELEVIQLREVKEKYSS